MPKHREGKAKNTYAPSTQIQLSGTNLPTITLLPQTSFLVSVSENRTVNQDLKPNNCIIRKDWSVMISDFGSATALEEKKTSTHWKSSTLYYLDPVHKPDDTRIPYTEQDIYAFGCIMYFVLTLRHPFLTQEEERRSSSLSLVYERLVEGQRVTISKEYDDKCPTGYTALTRNCLQDDIGLRPSLPSILFSLLSMQQQLSFSKPEFPLYLDISQRVLLWRENSEIFATYCCPFWLIPKADTILLCETLLDIVKESLDKKDRNKAVTYLNVFLDMKMEHFYNPTQISCWIAQTQTIEKLKSLDWDGFLRTPDHLDMVVKWVNHFKHEVPHQKYITDSEQTLEKKLATQLTEEATRHLFQKGCYYMDIEKFLVAANIFEEYARIVKIHPEWDNKYAQGMYRIYYLFCVYHTKKERRLWDGEKQQEQCWFEAWYAENPKTFRQLLRQENLGTERWFQDFLVFYKYGSDQFAEFGI